MPTPGTGCRIETSDGADFCYASYRPGLRAEQGVETDALQALVRMKGPAPRALYLGGGTVLKVGDASLRRSEAELAYVEPRSGGGYVVGNPSPAAATVTVQLKALNGLEAFEIDGEGEPKGAAPVGRDGAGAFSIPLRGGAAVAFLPRQ